MRSNTPAEGPETPDPPAALKYFFVSHEGSEWLVLEAPLGQQNESAPMPELTPAERASFLLIRLGLSVAHIASLRGVTRGTVTKQLDVLYKKLGVGSRRELLAKWPSAGAAAPELKQLEAEPSSPANPSTVVASLKATG